MAIVVAVLRIVMLFLNVYDSYKTLKYPPPSARNNGLPSVRAMTTRKRNMKGCLAVWIVFCVFALYERFAERIVCIFIPFYDEIKSFVILFLILTRARGAEPIYLHIIRPFLKPYTATLDGLLDLSFVFGDFLIALLLLPVRPFAMWWYSRVGGEVHVFDEVEDATKSPVFDPSPPPPAIHTASRTEVIETTIGSAKVRTISASQRHEVWHPPASAYEDEVEETISSSLSQKPNEPQLPSEEDMEWRKYPPLPSAYPPTPYNKGLSLPSCRVQHMPSMREEPVEVSPEVVAEDMEWRKYPSFPSAYPPTPLSASSRLPARSAAGASPFTTIAEEEPRDLGFQPSLPSPHELPNPSSACNASDDATITGVQDVNMDVEGDDSEEGDTGVAASVTAVASTIGDGNGVAHDLVDGDGEDNEEEEEFDTTLRAPLPPYGSFNHGRHRSSVVGTTSRPMSPSVMSGLTTSPSRLTTPFMGTIDDGFTTPFMRNLDDGLTTPFMGTVEEESSDSLSDTGSAGQPTPRAVRPRKRPLPPDPVGRTRAVVQAAPRSRRTTTIRRAARTDSSESESSYQGSTTSTTSCSGAGPDGTQSDSPSEAEATQQTLERKRRRVAVPFSRGGKRVARVGRQAVATRTSSRIRQEKPATTAAVDRPRAATHRTTGRRVK